jgi:ferredoxin, 2Fe-2S
MFKVTFLGADGQKTVVEKANGTLMDAAVKHGVCGIEGDCGGVGTCGTCHVHVDPEWTERVGPASELEQAVIGLLPDVSPCSRLGCQVELTEKLNGLVVRVPRSANVYGK